MRNGGVRKEEAIRAAVNEAVGQRGSLVGHVQDFRQRLPPGLESSTTSNTVAEARLLLLSVPMPKTMEPLTSVEPLAPTAGSSMITPLLSVVKAATGLDTCELSATPVSVHPPPFAAHEK